MDRFRVIFANLECAVEVSGVEPTLNREEKIAQLRLLENERNKTKQPKTGKKKKASKEVVSNNRVLFRYDIERVGVNGVVAEVFGRLCRGSEDENQEQKKEININNGLSCLNMTPQVFVVVLVLVLVLMVGFCCFCCCR